MTASKSICWIKPVRVNRILAKPETDAAAAGRRPSGGSGSRHVSSTCSVAS
jgi:hypothetical protein